MANKDYSEGGNGFKQKPFCGSFPDIKILIVVLKRWIKPHCAWSTATTFGKWSTDVPCKKQLQKTLHIREMRRFSKLQKWPLCKGYSLCKMVILGQKIKLPKTCEKLFYKHITDVLCKKLLQKILHIREMRRFSKLQKWPLWKAIAFAKWSFWAKK